MSPSNNKNNKLDDFINNHPKECLLMLSILGFSLLHLPACLLGIVIYGLAKRYKILVWQMLLLGGVSASTYCYFTPIDTYFFKALLHYNWLFLKTLFCAKYQLSFLLFKNYLLDSLPILAMFIAGIISLLDLIPKSAHANTLKAMQKGIISNDKKELPDKAIAKALARLDNHHPHGRVLGVSRYSGSPVIVPDKYINQVVLVLGTTGSGKTVTLNRFYRRAIYKGFPLIIVDGKPDTANIEKIKKYAEKCNRKFYGFYCGNYCNYDPLASGGYTELKDKIISLKDEWSSDYYRSIAEDYLQTTLAALQKSGESFDLKKVVKHLNHEDLLQLARELKDDAIQKKVASLEHYNRDDITGLQAHLNILINSELGQYFDRNVNAFHIWHLATDFLGFSYGFRPKRNAHDALDAVAVGMVNKKVNWVLDADIKGFFDNMDHECLLKFLRHRIADKRVLRLITKWLKAGVSEDGKWSETTKGCPQGSVISPLLSNIYLHYVLDLWVQAYRTKKAKGDILIVRYADDCARRKPQFKPVKVRSRELAMDPCSVGTGMIG